jgi:hypothetical protein
MALLKNLKQSLKFWWKPTWEQDYSYVVEANPTKDPVFRITRGKYRGVSFTLKDIIMKDADDGSGDGIVEFSADFISGHAPKDIVCAILQDMLMRAIERQKQLKREVLDDRTEDGGMDYFEEPVDERRVCPPSSSLPKE